MKNNLCWFLPVPSQAAIFPYFRVFLPELSFYSTLSALYCFWFSEFWHVFRLFQRRTGSCVFFFFCRGSQHIPHWLGDQKPLQARLPAPCGFKPLTFPDIFTFFFSCSPVEGVCLDPLWGPGLLSDCPSPWELTFCIPLQLPVVRPLTVEGSPCLPLSSTSSCSLPFWIPYLPPSVYSYSV